MYRYTQTPPIWRIWVELQLLCVNIAGQMWQPDWPAISAVLRFTRPPCHVIGTLHGLGYYARVTAARTNRALHTLEPSNGS